MVAILNDTLARQLFNESDPIGKMVLLNNQSFQVIGVYQTTSGFLKTMDGRRAALVELEGVTVPADARLGEEGTAGAVLEEVMDLGAALRSTSEIGRLDVFGQDKYGRFLAVGLPPIPSITKLEAIFHFRPDARVRPGSP